MRLAFIGIFGALNLGIAAPKTLDLVAYWNQGESVFYHVHYTQKSNQGKRSQSKMLDYKVQLKVIDSTANSYGLEWKTGDVDFVHEGLSSELVNELGRLGANIPIRYQTGEMGDYQSLTNKSEIQNLVLKAVNLTLKNQLKDQLQDSAVLQRTEAFKNVIFTGEVFESLILRDVKIFHSLYGGRYHLGAPKVYDFAWPNPWGGADIPGSLKVKVSKYNALNHTVQIDLVTRADPQKASKLIQDFMLKMGVSKDSIQFKQKLELSEVCKYTFDLTRNWPKAISYVKTVKYMDRTQVDTYEFKQMK